MRLEGTVAVLLVLAGCDRLFGIGTYNAGGGAALDSCGAAGFPTSTQAIQVLHELDNQVEGDPTLNGAGDEMYFVAPGSPYKIRRATRVAGTFAIDPIVPAFNIAAANNRDPAITADGQTLVFVSDAGGTEHGYLTTWNGSAWSPALLIPGLENDVMHSIEIAADGLTVYFTNGGLFSEARRTGPGSFTSLISSQNALEYPASSSDDLELLGTTSSIGGMWHMMRNAVSESFSQLSMVEAFGRDPDLSPDGNTLTFIYNGSQVGQLHRTCQ